VIAGLRVAVTGTGGDGLGAELAAQIEARRPASLHRFDGDVRDPQAVDEFFDTARPELVLHAATLLHRRLTERRPSEAVKTNIQGTDHLVRAALKVGAGRFVLVSSDLAARPESMAGASLRVAELVIERAAARARRTAGDGAPVLAAVRVGPAVDEGPEGSLADLLTAQLRAGGPVTLSSPDAVRSLVTTREVAERVLAAAALAVSGGIYEVDMGEPVRVVDLVARIAADQGLAKAPIRFTDPRGYPSGGVTAAQQSGRDPISHVLSISEGRDTSQLADLPERLEKIYASARKNRDPKVRQQLAKLARG
jgi:FlaA1/EpsC-like NDP-sugar epimerase